MKQRELGFFFILAFFALFMTACASKPQTIATETESEQLPPATIPQSAEENRTESVQAYIDKMSVEELIGQLFIIDLRKPGAGDPYQTMNDDIRREFASVHPGGVILFGGNLRSPKQTRELITQLQQLSAIGLFITTDEEGGPISRLNYSPLMSPGTMPSAEKIGATKDTSNAYTAGKIIGRQLKSLGINMNNAPDADVLTNPKNPVIGPRSYGNDPRLVGRMASAFLEGLSEEGVIGVMKHFPGHGDTMSDSHSGAVYVHRSEEQLSEIELVPFEIGINNDAKAIMTGHITNPEIDGLPATFSNKLLNEVLRKSMSYNGVIISDSMAMGAIARYWTSAEAAVRALNAGIDMLLIPDDLAQAYQGVLLAVKNGTLELHVVREKVRRILLLKAEYGILDKSDVYPDESAAFVFPEIEEFRKRIEAMDVSE